MSSPCIQKTTESQSIRIYQIKETAEVGRLKTEKNPDYRLDQQNMEMKSTEKLTEPSDPSLKEKCTQAWWYTSGMPALERLR